MPIPTADDFDDFHTIITALRDIAKMGPTEMPDLFDEDGCLHDLHGNANDYIASGHRLGLWEAADIARAALHTLNKDIENEEFRP